MATITVSGASNTLLTKIRVLLDQQHRILNQKIDMDEALLEAIEAITSK